LSTDDRHIAVAGEGDGRALESSAHGAGADKLRSLLRPQQRNPIACEDPRRSGVTVVEESTDD
jgi:hypothetical protein